MIKRDLCKSDNINICYLCIILQKNVTNVTIVTIDLCYNYNRSRTDLKCPVSSKILTACVFRLSQAVCFWRKSFLQSNAKFEVSLCSI